VSTIFAESAAGLASALKLAKPGDVIALAPGDYGALVLKSGAFGGVTITSLDSSNPATISGLNLTNVSGLRFDTLEFSTIGATDLYPFRLTRTSDISFNKLDVHGTKNGNPSDDQLGFLIRESDGISIKNSEFYEQKFGINHLDSKNLVFEGNYFHDLQTDGIRGGGSSNVYILNNKFTDFYPALGDHPDAIQFWTTNTTVSVSNIVVSGNVIERGNGAAMQGIFFRDATGTMPFQNVTIENNSLVGTMYNGIMIQGGKNVSIANNKLTSYTDMKTWIRLEEVDSVSILGNVALTYLYKLVTNMVESGNLLNLAVAPGTTVEPVATQPAPTPDPAPAPAQAPAPAPEPAPVTTTIYSGASYTLKTNETNLELTGNKHFDGTGNALGNVITGNTGNNQLAGLDGNDTISGGDGNDFIRGDAGDDLLQGNAGHDILYGGTGNDTMLGGKGNDNLYGEDGNDLLHGDDGDDRLAGNMGADTIYGGAGKDTITGGQGDDVLYGGDGADYLSGDMGNDVLWGGAGADTFNMQQGFGVNRVMDFSQREGDKILLTGVKSYTVSQVGSDTVVNLGGGDQMILVGVDMSALKSGWIMAG
jgi:Ca2+-binding RTX toxin-like protein